ncbi:hypothetical protein [Kribbella sp. NPDC049584]|uniref:hypothetical protein n=1 Tax=Kribbella sp. NPDC049584 TaxID=3154833 RepID=UPI0034256952
MRKRIGRGSIAAAVIVAGVSALASTAGAVPVDSVIARYSPDGHTQIDVSSGRIKITAGGSAVYLQTVGAWAGDNGTTVRGQITEKVQTSGGSAEQSWTLDHAPAASGDLSIAVAATGLDFAGTTDTGLLLRRTGDMNVSYSNGTWIDADGHATAVPAHYVNGRILLTVPAKLITESSDPAVLDPQIIVTPIT